MVWKAIKNSTLPWLFLLYFCPIYNPSKQEKHVKIFLNKQKVYLKKKKKERKGIIYIFLNSD